MLKIISKFIILVVLKYNLLTYYLIHQFAMMILKQKCLKY